MKKHLALLSISIAITAIAAKPSIAKAGILEFLFPTMVEREADPTDSLRAPFADPITAEEAAKPAQAKLPVNSVPLDKAHRLTAEVSTWVSTAIGESLNFTNNDPKIDLANTQTLFTPEGRQQYEAFLRDKNIAKVIDSSQYKIRSYVEDTPLMLNEGAVGGSYKWLYRVPVLISYMDANADSYEGAKPINQKATLDIQVGRSATTENESGIVIERWAGTITAQ